MRFSIRFTLVAIAGIALALAWLFGLARIQQTAAAAILSRGGYVFYEHSHLSDIIHTQPNDGGTSNSIFKNAIASVKSIRIEFYFYDDLKTHIDDLHSLETIEFTGHDSGFGAVIAKQDYPDLNIVDFDQLW